LVQFERKNEKQNITQGNQEPLRPSVDRFAIIANDIFLTYTVHSSLGRVFKFIVYWSS